MEHIERKAQKSNATLAICITALFMALNIMMSSFGLPVPGGHLYLNDVIICTAAILLDDPKAAFIVGGVGAFLGDLFFYPTPMFVSLVTHGIQAVVICLLAHRGGKVSFKGAALGVILGAVIMVVGYSLGLAFIYSTPHYAYIKLPYQILQAAVGAVGGLVLCFKAGLLAYGGASPRNGAGRSAGALRQNVPQIIFTANTKAVVRKQTYNSFFICVCALPRLGQQTTDHNILL